MKIILRILSFVNREINFIHLGQYTDQVASAAKLSIVPAFLLAATEGLTKWYFSNMWYMAFVFFAIMIDHLLGSYIHFFIEKDFNIFKNIKGLFTKCITCIIGYSIFIMIHEIMKDIEFIAIYFKVIIQLMVFIYPAGSAIGNLRIITGGDFPPDWMYKRFTKFQKTGDLDNFKFKKDEENFNSLLSSDSVNELQNEANSNGDSTD